MSEAPYIEWKEEYNLGDPIVDAQHQYLFTLANEVFSAESRDEILRSLMHLFRYVREHFHDEEALMERRKYDGLARHRELHNAMITELDLIAQAFHHLDTVGFIQKTQSFMVDWLLMHILSEDRRIPFNRLTPNQ
jgi:hemerythrin